MVKYIVLAIVSLAVAIATVSAQTKLPGCVLKCGCSSNYDPVCGSDGETYTNEGCLSCEAGCRPGLKTEYKGVCNATEVRNSTEPACKPKCACGLFYEPVCGSDGKTYSNQGCLTCEVECKKDLKVAHKGKCGSSASSTPSMGEEVTTNSGIASDDAAGSCNISCICTRKYEPVCASNGETYSNEGCLDCAAKCKPQLKMAYEGECNTMETSTDTADASSTDSPRVERGLTPVPAADCEKGCICVKSYSPVCGSDGQTYSNAGCLECKMPCKLGLKVAHEGECSTTPAQTGRPGVIVPDSGTDCKITCSCAAFWDPVCGSDGQTYSNDGCLSCESTCKLGLTVAYKGECSTTPAPPGRPGVIVPDSGNGCKSNCSCLAFWDPVCGSDGQTYSNDGCLSCESTCKLGLTVAYKGECSTTPAPPGRPGVIVPDSGNGCKNNCSCLAFWDPVCGSDGKTYSNEGCLSCDSTCKLGLKVAYKGECSQTQVPTSSPEPVDPSCKKMCGCTSNWAPVCGSDGKTYSNAGCLSCDATCKIGLTAAYDGECSQKHSAPSAS